MVRNRIYDIARDEDNSPIVGASVSLRRLVDNSEIDSTTTDAGGAYAFTEEEVGYEGPIKVRVTSLDGVVRERTGRSTGQTGTFFHSDLMRAFSVMNDGVVQGYDNELEVTADGVGRDVLVDSGLAFVAGHALFFSVPTDVDIGENISGNPRIDTIAISFTMPGETEEGKAEIIAVPGSPAPSPVAPTLTQTTALWQIPLANVAVANGAATISLGNVTDGRTFSTGPLIDNSIETVHIQNLAVTNAKLAAGIDATKLADGTVTNAELQFINSLTSNAQTQIDSKAATSHTHLLAGVTDVTASAAEVNVLDGVSPTLTAAELSILDGVTASAAELNVLDGIPGTLTAAELGHVDGVTSAIQPQIDGKAATSHAHAGTDITSGTIPFTRMPTGLTSTSVALGDHDHSYYALLTGANFTGTVTTTGNLVGNNVTATGDFSVGDDLDVTGTGTLGEAIVDGNLTVGSHALGGKIRMPERSIMPTIGLGGAAGTGGTAITMLRGGSDSAGTIRITTGSSGVTTGIIAQVTFAQARATTEYQVIPAGQSTAAGLGAFVSGIATTGFDIRVATAPATGATVDISYLVIDMV